MKNFRPGKLKKSFTSFVISYIFMILISIGIGSFAYVSVYHVLESYIMKEGLATLQKEKEIIDNCLIEIEKMVVQLNLDEDVIAAGNIGANPEGVDYYNLIKLNKKLISYNLTNTFVDNFYLCLRDSGILVSNSSIAVLKIDEYYNNNLKYEGMEYASWYEMVTGEYHYKSFLPEHNIISEKSRKSVITYLQSFPLGYYNNYKGVFLATINKDKICQLLDINDAGTNGWIHVHDSNNNIILSKNITEKEFSTIQIDSESKNGYAYKDINGRKMVIIHSVSDYCGWNYVIGLPASIFSDKLANVRNLVLLTALILVIAGMLAALYFTYRNNRPVKKLLNTALRIMNLEGRQAKNEYDFIEGTISDLVHNNSVLKSELDKQQPILKAVYWERLLRGNFNSLNEINSALPYMDLEITGDYFVVVIMRVNGFNSEISEDIRKELSAAKLVANNLLLNMIGRNGYISDVDNDKISILLFSSEKMPDVLEDQIEDLLGKCIDELYNNYNIRVSFSIGGRYKSLLDVCSSYEEARKSMEYWSGEMRRIVWFKDIPEVHSTYYYPQDFELKLMYLARMGQIDEILNILQIIYKRNISIIIHPENELMQLKYEIRGTIIKIKEAMILKDDLSAKVESLLNQLDNSKQWNSFCLSVNGIYKLFCEIINERKKCQNKNLIKRIIEYIDMHYTDDDICLSKVASEFDLTEKYLSCFFKEQTGEAFIAYIEKKRMELALDMLAKKDLSISDILKNVGYININTFYKAFKRVYGVSPRTYRKENNKPV